MIKIFGKIRYHWQPELSWILVYWSIAVTPVFIGLTLLYERWNVSSKMSSPILGLFALTAILFLLGFHRYFTLEEEWLQVVSATPWGHQKIPIRSIQKVLVTHLSIQLVTTEFPEGKIYYMRKWPKKYFINALALHPHFQGEVELLGSLTQFEDYLAE